MLLAIFAVLFAVSAYVLSGQALAAGGRVAWRWNLWRERSPWPHARYLESRRRDRFVAQLPGVLDLISGALRSGMSLSQALQAAATDSAEPAAAEFVSVATAMSLGDLPEAALDALASRFKGAACEEELRMFATTVAVTRGTGGNLAELLSALADTLRERARLRAEISSLTAQGRMSGLIVGLLPFLLLLALSLLDPGLVQPMFSTPTGLLLLGAGLLLELIGFVLIRRIVDIDL